MNIDHVPLMSVRPAKWRTTYVLKPDMKLLKLSLVESGWLAPLLVKTDGTIIDGFHRWVAAQDPQVRRTLGETVPVTWVDVDEIDAMIMHVRMNRARGEIVARPFSRLLHRVLASEKYTTFDLKTVLAMTGDEIDLMINSSLLKNRKLAEHTYSKAWVPVEAPPGAAVATPVIERPPNADR